MTFKTVFAAAVASLALAGTTTAGSIDHPPIAVAPKVQSPPKRSDGGRGVSPAAHIAISVIGGGGSGSNNGPMCAFFNSNVTGCNGMDGCMACCTTAGPRCVPRGGSCPINSHLVPIWGSTCDDVCGGQFWCKTCVAVPWCAQDLTSGKCIAARGSYVPNGDDVTGTCPEAPDRMHYELGVLDVFVAGVWAAIATLFIVGWVVAFAVIYRAIQLRRARSREAQRTAELQQEQEPLMSQLSRTSFNSADEGEACQLCMERRATVVFLPCHHMTTCRPCSLRLETPNGSTTPAVRCPVCRSHIVHMVHVGTAPRCDPADTAVSVAERSERDESGAESPAPAAYEPPAPPAAVPASPIEGGTVNATTARPRRAAASASSTSTSSTDTDTSSSDGSYSKASGDTVTTSSTSSGSDGTNAPPRRPSSVLDRGADDDESQQEEEEVAPPVPAQQHGGHGRKASSKEKVESCSGSDLSDGNVELRFQQTTTVQVRTGGRTTTRTTREEFEY